MYYPPLATNQAKLVKKIKGSWAYVNREILLNLRGMNFPEFSGRRERMEKWMPKKVIENQGGASS